MTACFAIKMVQRGVHFLACLHRSFLKPLFECNLLVCVILRCFFFFLQQDKPDVIRPKRKYEKKPKVLPSSAAATPQQTSPAALPVFNAKDLNQYDFPSSDEEPLSQVGPLEFCAALGERIEVKFMNLLISFLKHSPSPL